MNVRLALIAFAVGSLSLGCSTSPSGSGDRSGTAQSSPAEAAPDTAASTAPAPPAAVAPAAPAATPGSPPASGGQPARGQGAAPPTSPPARAPEPPAPEYREVTIPAGTRLSVVLDTSLASNTSKVEDPVRAYFDAPLTIDGMTIFPRKTTLVGTVTEAAQSGKVKGRARLSFRFDSARAADGEEYALRTATISREAAGTKKKDAGKVGIGAAAGAIIGGIAGGGKGAAVGTAVGAGAGTGVVMATRGDEVQIPAGTRVSAQLTAPVTVRIRVR